MKKTTTTGKNPIVCAIDKIYGGLNMSWRNVILFAFGTAVLTTVFLIVPIFKNTSFIRMGVSFESWVFFAIIIMANCNKQETPKNAGFLKIIKEPLLCAAKVFVFFLISQPLIYLFQVPFSDMGWKLFGYYPYWFKWTLATIPMAFIGWYINKKNWLSLIILLPVCCMLTFDYTGAFGFTFKHFPHQLVTGLFCLAQVLVYVWVFMSKLLQKLIGFFLPLAVFVVFTLLQPPFEINANRFLPDDLQLTENAVVEVSDPEDLEISIIGFGEDTMIQIHATAYTDDSRFTITDGDNIYHYSLKVYEDNGGHQQIDITLIDQITRQEDTSAEDASSAE